MKSMAGINPDLEFSVDKKAKFYESLNQHNKILLDASYDMEIALWTGNPFLESIKLDICKFNESDNFKNSKAWNSPRGYISMMPGTSNSWSFLKCFDCCRTFHMSSKAHHRKNSVQSACFALSVPYWD